MYLSHGFGTVGILHGVYCIARVDTDTNTQTILNIFCWNT